MLDSRTTSAASKVIPSIVTSAANEGNAAFGASNGDSNNGTALLPRVSATQSQSRSSTTGHDSRSPSNNSRPNTFPSRPGTSLKDSLKEYISNEDPSWKQDAKQILRKFGRLLRSQYPNIIENLKTIHRKPFASYRGSIAYESARNYSFINVVHPRNRKGLRSSWSCIDLKTFRNTQGVDLDGSVDRLGQEGESRVIHIRSNSFNTRFDLRNSNLRRKIVPAESGSESDTNDYYITESDPETEDDDFDFEEVLTCVTNVVSID